MYPNIQRQSEKISKKKFLCMKTLFRAYIWNIKKVFFPTFRREGGGLPPSGKFPTFFFFFNEPFPNPVCLQRIEKRLCLVFSGAHRQYINKMILMRKGIDIICVASGQKVLRYTDFSRIYKINADVYLLRHHPVLRKFLHIHPHISISSGYDLPQKKTFKWLF